VGYVAVALVFLVLSVAGLFGGCAKGSGVGDDDDDGVSTSTSSSSSTTSTSTSGTGGAGAQAPGGGGGTVGGGGGTVGGAGGGTAGSGGVGGMGGGPPCGYGSPVCFISEWDFDSGCPSGWTTTGNNSDWGCGPPTSGPNDDCGGNGNVWATGLHGLASTCQNSYLESPVVDLSAYQGQTVLLGFYHWYDFRECINPSLCFFIDWLSYSGGRVEVNSGNGWVTVTPQGGYEVGGKTVECADGSGGSPSCGGAQCDIDGSTSAYTCGGIELQWHQALIDVSNHTTNTFQARFVFGNADMDPFLFVNRPGWYIDNVALLRPIACP